MADITILENVCSKVEGAVESLIVPDGVSELAPYAVSEHRELLSVSIPETVTKIGAHAFYNCRSLSHLELTDCIEDIGDGAFKNCQRIRTITIHIKKGQFRVLKGILSDINQEIRVNLIYPDVEAHLIFPYYLYNYEENTPARIVNQITEGAGIQYQACIRADGIDFAGYDRLFKSSIYIDVQDSGFKIAIARLSTPLELSDAARAQYEAFLKEHAVDICEKLLEADNQEDFKTLLQLNLFEKDTLDKVVNLCQRKAFTAGLSTCIEYKNKRFGGRKKTYEF